MSKAVWLKMPRNGKALKPKGRGRGRPRKKHGALKSDTRKTYNKNRNKRRKAARLDEKRKELFPQFYSVFETELKVKVLWRQKATTGNNGPAHSGTPRPSQAQAHGNHDI